MPLVEDPDEESRLDVKEERPDCQHYHLWDLELCRQQTHDDVWLISRDCVLSNEDENVQTSCRRGDFEPQCSKHLQS